MAGGQDRTQNGMLFGRSGVWVSPVILGVVVLILEK